MKSPIKLERVTKEEHEPDPHFCLNIYVWSHYDILLRFFGKEFRFHLSAWNVEEVYENNRESNSWVKTK